MMPGPFAQVIAGQFARPGVVALVDLCQGGPGP
jgi:hypothetical protein